ncbi:hypothetical protein BLNAU_13950 [Blattamonas nauphoetae]|uniref:Uncharacterized protein n=1 Tax=Blattamonas nauphoetae TaxID=2049346 RepID=A0ABQ9XIA9_9EUKA|nr:hypothetical protein BLNAU_13950 [Blattamonas nauphoetae]
MNSHQFTNLPIFTEFELKYSKRGLRVALPRPLGIGTAFPRRRSSQTHLDCSSTPYQSSCAIGCETSLLPSLPQLRPLWRNIDKPSIIKAPIVISLKTPVASPAHLHPPTSSIPLFTPNSANQHVPAAIPPPLIGCHLESHPTGGEAEQKTPAVNVAKIDLLGSYRYLRNVYTDTSKWAEDVHMQLMEIQFELCEEEKRKTQENEGLLNQQQDAEKANSLQKCTEARAGVGLCPPNRKDGNTGEESAASHQRFTTQIRSHYLCLLFTATAILINTLFRISEGGESVSAEFAQSAKAMLMHEMFDILSFHAVLISIRTRLAEPAPFVECLHCAFGSAALAEWRQRIDRWQSEATAEISSHEIAALVYLYLGSSLNVEKEMKTILPTVGLDSEQDIKVIASLRDIGCDPHNNSNTWLRPGTLSFACLAFHSSPFRTIVLILPSSLCLVLPQTPPSAIHTIQFLDSDFRCSVVTPVLTVTAALHDVHVSFLIGVLSVASTSCSTFYLTATSTSLYLPLPTVHFHTMTYRIPPQMLFWTLPVSSRCTRCTCTYPRSFAETMRLEHFLLTRLCHKLDVGRLPVCHHWKSTDTNRNLVTLPTHPLYFDQISVPHRLLLDSLPVRRTPSRSCGRFK